MQPQFCLVCGEGLAQRPTTACRSCRREVHADCSQEGRCSSCAQQEVRPTAKVEPPAAALTCPHCGKDAEPRPQAQTCLQCRREFTLRAGALLDPNVRPPGQAPNANRITVKWSATLAYRSGTLDPQGVAVGTLDPITGQIPLEQSGIAFADIFSIAVWRKKRIFMFALALFFYAPFLFSFGAITLKAPGFVILVAFFLGLLVYAGYRALVVQANWMRICGPNRTLEIRFDSPGRRRRLFHDELMRRAGLEPGDFK